VTAWPYLATVAAVIAAALAGPFLDPNLVHVLVLVALYGTLALSWNVLGGMAGQVSIGHSLFVGTGAYLSTALYLFLGVSPWIGLVLGVILGAAFGATIGFVVFGRRLTGIYFALVTLAIGEMAYYVVSNIDGLGAANGLYIAPSQARGSFQFAAKSTYLDVAACLLVVAIVVTFWIRHSRLGYRLAAIRENERAAAALGIDVVSGKIAAAAISGAIAAPVGTFYAQYILYVDPDSLFGVSFSIEALTHAFVGGLYAPLGPLLGSLVLVPLSEALRSGLGGRFAGAHLIIYGIILVLIVRLAPEGLAGLLRPRRAAKAPERRAATAAERQA
jgi:branched-chain amino acid transport system permease protein